MSIASNYRILILTVMSILVLSVLGEKRKANDDGLCPRIRTVLCVKDVLLDIANAAQEIKDIAHKTEQDILRHTSTTFELTKYVNHLTNKIGANLPTSKYHNQFKHATHINKNDLIDVMKEEYYAFSYLYNSIKMFLQNENIFEHPVDADFKKIIYILQNNILCNYRSIFDVYSQTWLSVDQISGIQIINTSSYVYHSYTIIINRLLSEWIKHMDYFIGNIGDKFL